MQRRKFVIGAGALASGAAAAVGTGAFSAALIDGRDANIAVTADDNSLVSLVPGNEAVDDGTVSDEFVDQTDNTLEIDLEGDDGQGMNVGSTYQLGAIGDDGTDAMNSGLDNGLGPEDVIYGNEDDQWLDEADVHSDPAFAIKNETENDINVQLYFDADEIPDGVEGAFVLVGQQVDFEQGAAALSQGLRDQPTGETTAGVKSGEYAGVSILLTADEEADLGAIEGTLEVRAEGAIVQT